MRTLYQMRKCGLLTMSLLTTIASSACGAGANLSGVSERESTEDELYIDTAQSQDTGDLSYVAEGIVLPDHFDNMIYPMETLCVEQYSQGLPYYRAGDSDTSFWFSMALLSSLFTEQERTDAEVSEDYTMCDRLTIDTYAGALYRDYVEGKMPLAEVNSEDPYVIYDEDSQQYGLLNGSISNLSVVITKCEEVEKQYSCNVQLVSLDSNKVLSDYKVDLQLQDESSRKGSFFYTISDIQEISKETVADTSSTEETKGQETQAPQEEPADQMEEDTEDIDSQEANDMIQYPGIGLEAAYRLASEYCGEGDSLQFRQIVTIGDQEYYDFEDMNHEVNIEILVSSDGQNILTGVHNSDGSWTMNE